MKSSAACYTRRPRGATFDENESSIVAPSLSEANSTTCHCHCPPSSCGAFEKDDGVSFLPSTTCDLCERLRGQTGECYDSVDAIWTGNSHAADRSSRRKRDENNLTANDSKAIVGKRDRTLRCDRTPLRESSARCASSVVRWTFAARFHGDFKSTEWRLLWIVLLILAVRNLAAADNTTVSSSRNGGKYALFSPHYPFNVHSYQYRLRFSYGLNYGRFKLDFESILNAFFRRLEIEVSLLMKCYNNKQIS